ncbi:MAG: flagellar biosynthetic protein FliR [Clostridia bacterium]|nr:flagellar biosynthetic protein FliR [Clostridia bacterium]
MSGQIIVEGLGTYILVFCRMGSMLFFNPLLARKNVISSVKIALALGLTLIITPTLDVSGVEGFDGLVFLFAMLKEFLVGFVFGLIFQIFYYMLFAAGDIIDMGFGLSMAKAFDPGTNIQVSFSGNLFQLLFVMYFFATDSHLTFIRIMVSSYDMVSVGAVIIGQNTAEFLMTMFVSAFALIIKLCIPFIVATFVLEVAMGILMKLTPQINIFSIHFPMKIFLGFILLFLFAVPVGNFMENYIDILNDNLYSMFKTV